MKALWIILAVVVVLCLILYIACVLMVKVGIAAGTKPRQIKRKPHTGAETPVQRQLRETKEQGRAWQEKQSFETVTIQSRDGLKLVGYYLACPQAKRTVLLVHGWRGDWSDMWEYGDFLQEQECNMLFVEQRGHGASEGKYMGFGVLERRDCMKWVQYLQERAPELPIYLLGCSPGAATVLMTSGFGLPGTGEGHCGRLRLYLAGGAGDPEAEGVVAHAQAALPVPREHHLPTPGELFLFGVLHPGGHENQPDAGALCPRLRGPFCAGEGHHAQL